MAFDAYMTFQDSQGNYLKGESQMQVSSSAALDDGLTAGQIFEISDFSFDIEQILNIGSASSGAGAGKVTFNPYSITRTTDRASPTLFTMCCAGQHFKQVSLYLRRAGGAAGSVSSGTTAGSATAQSGLTFLRFDFALVAVKTINWTGSDGDESPKEEVTFEYGALQVRYQQQDTTGVAKGAPTVGAWNQVYNNNNYTTIAAS
jgi:type VI secretion system Hcp family effector